MSVIRRRLAVVAASAALAAGGFVAGAPAAGAAPAAEPYCNYISDSSRPYVYPGNTGAKVKQVQCLINMYSAYPNWLDEDGIYGPNTKAGVGWVQRCNGTTGGVDHIVGPSTWSRLYNPKAACAF